MGERMTGGEPILSPEEDVACSSNWRDACCWGCNSNSMDVT